MKRRFPIRFRRPRARARTANELRAARAQQVVGGSGGCDDVSRSRARVRDASSHTFQTGDFGASAHSYHTQHTTIQHDQLCVCLYGSESVDCCVLSSRVRARQRANVCGFLLLLRTLCLGCVMRCVLQAGRTRVPILAGGIPARCDVVALALCGLLLCMDPTSLAHP